MAKRDRYAWYNTEPDNIYDPRQDSDVPFYFIHGNGKSDSENAREWFYAQPTQKKREILDNCEKDGNLEGTESIEACLREYNPEFETYSEKDLDIAYGDLWETNVTDEGKISIFNEYRMEENPANDEYEDYGPMYENIKAMRSLMGRMNKVGHGKGSILL